MTDRLAQYIFLVLGMGVLVPWNAFISAVPYFQLRICTLPNASQHFESWVGFLFNLSSVIALLMLMAWPWIQQQRRRRGLGQPSSQQQAFMGLIGEEEEETDAEQQPTPATARVITTTRSQEQEHSNHDNNDGNNASDGHSSSYWIVTLPFVFYLGVFFVTDLMVLPIPFSPFLFLTLTLMSMMICGACAAIGGAGIVAFAGQYYPANIGINPFVSGQAVGGVIVSAANFISAMAEDPNLYWKQYCHATNYTSNAVAQDSSMLGTGNDNNSFSSSIMARLNNRTLATLRSAAVTATTTTTTCPPYETLDRAVFLYFLVGAVVLLCCILGFHLLHQSTRQQQQQFPPSSPSESLSVAPLQPHPLQDQPGDEQQENDGNQDGDDDGEFTDALETFQDEAPSPRSGLELRASHRHPHASASATHEKKHPRQQTHTRGNTDTNTTSRTAMMIDRQASYHEDDGPAITACRLPSNFNSSSTGDDDPTATVRQSHSVSVNFDEISMTSAHHNDIFKAVKGPAFCIFLTFFVTLSLFPSWTSTLKSIHQCTPGSLRVNNDLFTPMTFLLFNIGDLGGRLLAGSIPVSRMRNFSTKLVVAACLRCLFFPMLLLCVGGDDAAAYVHADDDNTNHLLGTTTSIITAATGQRMQIESDVYSILVQSLFALSNGFLISLAFMHAPTLIPATPSSQEKSSEILTLALSFGLMCGSLFSFVVSKLV